MKIGSLITTCPRPGNRSPVPAIKAVVALGAPVLVVRDGPPDGPYLLTPETARALVPHVHVLEIGDPDHSWGGVDSRRGLAAALNIGLSWWLADPDITHISYFQDDVEVDPLLHEVALVVVVDEEKYLFTGHDAKEHLPVTTINVNGMRIVRKDSCRATQMFASRAAWERVLPIRSRGLGLPGYPAGVKASDAGARGGGSDVDWWITRDAPNKLDVLCVPDLVRTPLWEAKDSTWGNTQRTGADPPLSRAAIAKWLAKRGA